MTVDAHYPPSRGRRKNDRTAQAVELQLAAMACPQYEVGVYDASARQMTPRLLSAEGVMTSLAWLKHRNAGGADIYVRPFGSVGLVLVDDVTPASLARLYADGLDPAAVVLTSPDNYQAWVRLSASAIAEEIATAAARELARCYGADLAAAKWRQYGRLAGFTNRKPRHQQADGRYPFVRFIVGRRGVAPGAVDLLAAVESPTPDRATPPAVELSFSAPRSAIVCVLVDEYRRQVAEHCRRWQVDDWSRLDWMLCCTLASMHPEATVSELARAIVLASPRLSERHRGREDKYALHTAAKALAWLRDRRGNAGEGLPIAGEVLRDARGG